MTTFIERFGSLLHDRWPELILRLAQHIQLVGVALFFATLLGSGLGLLLSGRPRLGRWALTAANIVQTIPSLALLAFLLPVLGIGAVPAICALTLYAVMPILRNALAVLGDKTQGLASIGAALGLTQGEIVRHIQIPQGLPLLISGLRTATVWSVGTATLSAFIGAGGLGEFINRGISLLDPALLMLGAVPAAMLALGLDALLGWLEGDCETWKNGHTFPKRKWASLLLLLGLGVVFIEAFSTCAPIHAKIAPLVDQVETKTKPVRIGTKNFAEQIVLGELIAQYLEAHGQPVARPLPAFQSTELIHGALVHGDIDLYVEYLGTAAQVILKLPSSMEADPTSQVRTQYRQRFHLAWLDALGFSNTYAVVTRREVAHGATTLSQFAPLAPRFSAGLNSEFIERPDGLPALEKIYGLRFGRIDTLDAGLLYAALNHRRVDAIVGFSTDAQLTDPNLVLLADDKHAFPRYDAVPVVSEAVLQSHPKLVFLLSALAGRFDEAAMRSLNAQVELKFRPPADVARDYWMAHPMP